MLITLAVGFTWVTSPDFIYFMNKYWIISISIYFCVLLNFNIDLNRYSIVSIILQLAVVKRLGHEQGPDFDDLKIL